MNMEKISCISNPVSKHPDDFPRDLGELLLYAAGHCRGKGIVHINGEGLEEKQSYAELFDAASGVLAGMQDRGIGAGDKIIVELTGEKEFFTVFWGAVLGGIIPVPINEPASFKSDDFIISKMHKVWNLLEHPYLVTNAKNREKYRALSRAGAFAGLLPLAVNDLEGGKRGLIHKPRPGDTAFLQFSSGSTGDPKGVILTHGNITSNVWAIARWLELTDEDVSASWLPHTHDMGLIGLHMCSLVAGIEQLKMLPQLFIARPHLFLEKIGAHKVTITGMPGFGLKRMIECVTDDKMAGIDLSSIRCLINGAEAISVKMVDDFCRKFHRCGFNRKAMFPVYGLAEASLAVSFPETGAELKVHKVERESFLKERRLVEHDGENVMLFVDEGFPLYGISIRITDADGNPVGEAEAGNIEIKGPNVTTGYYNDPRANHDLFTGEWLKTGDTGFIKDGRLTIIGRCKDMVSIKGQNIYTTDVIQVLKDTEKVIDAEIAVSGTINAEHGEEELIIFVRFKNSTADFIPVYHTIKNTLRKTLGIDARMIVPVKQIPKTTSGKIQHFKMKENYERGEYKNIIDEIMEYLEKETGRVPAVSCPPDEVEKKLCTIFNQIFQFTGQEIKVEDDILKLGISSLKLIQLIDKIEEEFDISIPMEKSLELIMDFLTIKKIAAYLNTVVMTGKQELHDNRIAPEQVFKDR